MIYTPTTEEITIRREGLRIVLLFQGRRICTMPWRAAEMLADALTAQARHCEEWENADAIMLDQAILTRVGANIGLTNNRHIQKAAQQEAAWNSDLRRYIRGKRAKGIDSQETFGAPSISIGKPKWTTKT